jgi:hypothetical protein
MAETADPPGQTPPPEAPPGQAPTTPVDETSTQQTPIDSLPSDAQDLIKRLRQEAAARRTENLELKTQLDSFTEAQMTDLEKANTKAATAESRATSAETKLMRYEVAIEKGVPSNAMDFLTGTTREELEQSADKLKSLIGSNGEPPPPDFGAGVRPPGGNGTLTDSESFSQQLRRAAGRR